MNFLANFLTQISKISQSGGSLGLLSIKISPLMKVTVPLAKYILASLRVTAAASVIDTGIQKKNMVLEQQL